MKKFMSVVLLILVSSAISLGLARLSMPIDGVGWSIKEVQLSRTQSRPWPKVREPPLIQRRETTADRCEQGDWRSCIVAADEVPARRGLLLRRAEWILDNHCHPTPGQKSIQPCGELALMRVRRSPREVPVALECLDHAIRDCDWEARHDGGCDLVAELPPQLLTRPEWKRRCASGDEVACRLQESGDNVR